MITEILLLGATLLAPADTTPAAKSLAAHRLAPGEAAPVLDGRLNDAAWAQAPVATDFVQRYPDAGRPGTQRTEARVLYDGDAVYVAMRAWDTAPDSIASQLSRRDASGIYSDWLHVMFDSYHDRRSAYRFAVNPHGVKKDVYHFDDGGEDLGWDAVWEVETAIDSAGWTAEFRIPLSQLRFRPQEAGQTWGLNFSRELARREERTWWTEMHPDLPGFVSRIGTLTGLQGLRSPRRLELLPYTVAGVTREPGEGDDPFYAETDPNASFGADLKYGLSGDLTLTATINPDFGQVEADPSEVNLSAFESFFAEKRPFFTEGSDIFSFGLGLGDDNSESLFYSRRIGRAPQRGVSRNPDRPFVDAPQQTTILGAAKLTGRIADGWSIGVLNAVTAREHTRFQVAGTGEVDELVSEPATNYAMARVRHDMRQGRSAVGAVLTATHRFLGDEEGLLFLPSASYAGGLDFRHRFANDGWEASGWVVGSTVGGDSLAIRRLQLAPQRYYQREDADHLRFEGDATRLSGTSASFHLGKISGRYRGGVLGLYRSPGFEVNDLGYLREPDRVEVAGYGRWFRSQPQGPFRRWDLGWNLYTASTTGNERMYTGGNVNGSWQLSSLWSGYGGVGRNHGGLEVRELRGGPALRYDGSWNGWFGVGSDGRRSVRVGIDGNWYVQDQNDDYALGLSPFITARPSSRVTLTLSPSWSRNRESAQYVATGKDAAAGGATRYFFGELDQTTVALTARLNYTFTPNLTLQLYAQPFVSAGEYAGFKEVADPRAERFANRYDRLEGDVRACDGFYGVRPQAAGCGDEAGFAYTVDNPDFNFKQFRSNAVLRWEYRPGSTMFVVWSQGRENFLSDGSFRLGRDFGRLFGRDDAVDVPATNVLLIKFSYWLNL